MISHQRRLQCANHHARQVIGFPLMKPIFAGAIAAMLLLVDVGGMPAQAKQLSISRKQEASRGLQFVPQATDLGDFADTGIPENRSAAGTRGSCPAPSDSAPLTAIVPMLATMGQEKALQVPLGNTANPFPTFWVHIPYPVNAINRLVLVLREHGSQPDAKVSVVDVPIEALPGTIGIPWPSTEFPLEVNRSYRWFLLVDCQPGESVDTFVEALIQRTEPSAAIANQLVEATPEERVFIYAENGFWHDAVTELNRLRQTSPNNPELEENWRSLLESADLEPLP